MKSIAESEEMCTYFVQCDELRELSIASEFLSFPSLMFNCPGGRDTYRKYVLGMRIVSYFSKTCARNMLCSVKYLVVLEMRLERHIGLYTKCPLLISNCEQNRYVSTDVSSILQ